MGYLGVAGASGRSHEQYVPYRIPVQSPNMLAIQTHNRARLPGARDSHAGGIRSVEAARFDLLCYVPIVRWYAKREIS